VSIPKILHFTWKTEEVPGVMADYLRRWRALHPGWEVRLWTDATMRDFVGAAYPDFLAAYDAYPRPIQRADCFRYLVLNALGGVYSDLDVEPFRAIDELIDGLTCFAGIEPDEHMGSDRWHSGTPFLVTNAFIGGVPGHPWFRQLVALLPQTAGIADIFQSTGPGVTTGAAVRLPRDSRPKLVLPQQWSPTIDGGKPSASDQKLRTLLGGAFDFVEVDGPFVAHRWMTSWVPWHKRHKWLARPFHAMNAAKWAFRKWWHTDLAAVDISDALSPYFDQTPKPPETWPKVVVSVIAEDGPDLPDVLLDALAALDYPAAMLSLLLSRFGHEDAEDETVPDRVRAKLYQWAALAARNVAVPPEHPGGTLTDAHRRAARWSMLANAGASADGREGAEFVLFVDSRVTGIPAGALKAMLSANKPVVALGARAGDGTEADLSVFRYTWGGGIRVVYKIRGEDGLADPARGQRGYLSHLKAFAEIPLDGAGQSCVLVRSDVLDAGVRFAEVPYHLHLGGEGLALMTRHKGFEVAGLTELAVERAQ
jgi:hypothetical protein